MTLAKKINNDITDHVYEKDSWLYWKTDRGSNKIKDCLAGYIGSDGYYCVCINGISYKNHRILYQFYNNVILTEIDVIDHHNKNKTDNRKENLRLDPNSQNQQNTKTYKNNLSTGLKNITIKTNKEGRKYYNIQISKNKKRVFSKYYRTDRFTEQEVIEIRDEQLKIYHGEFASFY